VLEGDTTDLLAYSGPDALYLEDGDSIKSEVGSLAILILPIPGKAPSLSHNKKIEIDTIAPTVTEVNTDKENGVYGVGESIDIQVNFSEPVKISGILSLTLETGDVDRLITCNLDPDQNVSSITCVYTVQPGDFSIKLDYVEGNSLIISEGSVADQAGNIAVLTPPAPGSINSLSYNKDIQINSISAQVEQVLTHKVDGIYGTGEVIDILVKFNEPVNVTGVPSITLGLDINQNVNYSSGSGTDTLIFTYSVKSGDNTARLDYTSSNALTLNGVDSSTPKTYSNLYFNSLTS